MTVTYSFKAVEDDIQVRGNAVASGDDAEDKRVEDEILDRLERGDVWAWASVTVTARVTVNGHSFFGNDHLGCCSYKDGAEFEKDGYYADMCEAAREDLKSVLATSIKRGQIAASILQELF